MNPAPCRTWDGIAAGARLPGNYLQIIHHSLTLQDFIRHPYAFLLRSTPKRAPVAPDRRLLERPTVGMVPETRTRSLDGLRALAVSLVLVYHTLDFSHFRVYGLYQFDKFAPGAGGVRL